MDCFVHGTAERDNVPQNRNEREDSRHFETLFRATRSSIYRLAYAQLRNASDAEDITQETFVRAWANFAAYDRTRPFNAWALRIATNLIVDHRRRGKRRQALSLDALPGTLLPEERMHELAASGCDPFAAVLASQRNAELKRAIRLLSANHRESIGWLAQEYTYEQIAALMQCPTGTVRSRVHRARKQLRHVVASTMRDSLLFRELEGKGGKIPHSGR